MCEQIIREAAAASANRLDLWCRLVEALDVVRMAEIGVYRGEFAETVFKQCHKIEKYYMIDPWRHLDDWDKPANKQDDVFEQYLEEVRSRTEFASDKRVILRGKTTEVIDEIPDGSLDFAYIDGDHTLKGITIDLLRVYSKVRGGGWIGGDDFAPSIWQYSSKFEPTLVFPFAVYFAEAIGAPIYGLPRNQFLIRKDPSAGFSFVDLAGRYGNTGLKSHLNPAKMMALRVVEALPLPRKAAKRTRKRILR